MLQSVGIVISILLSFFIFFLLFPFFYYYYYYFFFLNFRLLGPNLLELREGNFLNLLVLRGKEFSQFQTLPKKTMWEKIFMIY